MTLRASTRGAVSGRSAGSVAKVCLYRQYSLYLNLALCWSAQWVYRSQFFIYPAPIIGFSTHFPLWDHGWKSSRVDPQDTLRKMNLHRERESEHDMKAVSTPTTGGCFLPLRPSCVPSCCLALHLSLVLTLSLSLCCLFAAAAALDRLFASERVGFEWRLPPVLSPLLGPALPLPSAPLRLSLTTSSQQQHTVHPHHHPDPYRHPQQWPPTHPHPQRRQQQSQRRRHRTPPSLR